MKKAAFAASALALAVSQTYAGTETWFTPLTSSTTVMAPNDINELTSPWVHPEDVKFTNLTSLKEVEGSIGESIVRADTSLVGRGGNVGSMIDMMWYDPSGRYIFLPHETPISAGLSRYDTITDETHILFMGDSRGSLGDWSNDFGAFDPSRITPNDTAWVAEEWAGTGRMVEYLDPYGPPPGNPIVGNGEVDPNVRVLSAFPLVSHEGISFSNDDPNRTVYFVDENNSGSIYKIVFRNAGDYSIGQTFVLRVRRFNEDPSLNWNQTTQSRVGAAVWVPMTSQNGVPRPEITNDPFTEAFGGRQAADDILGTPYGRPEDTAVSRLANGNEVLYFAATSEATVYSVEMTDARNAVVREFASNANTPKNFGFPGTSGILNSPDNLALDGLGNVYIIEDSPNTTEVGATGGDVWFARDVDSDGVAESIDHFLSLGVNQSEATGMIFNPRVPTEFAIAVQHPASTDLGSVPDGFGDAVWKGEIKLTDTNRRFWGALRRSGSGE